MRCDFTREAISGVLERPSVACPAAVVLPKSPGSLATGWPSPPFDRWLESLNIAVLEVDGLSGADLDAVLSFIADHQVTLGVGACFPFRVRREIRGALPHGVLNIHPSLLPNLRGPEPVFHAYRLGVEETGVTIHVMDDGWDSGPVLAQRKIAIPPHVPASELEASLARRGGELLGSLADAWVAGSLTAIEQRHQDATWAPLPAGSWLDMPETLTVAQAGRFAAAVIPSVGCLRARDLIDGEWHWVTNVADEDTVIGTTAKDNSRIVHMRCADGVLQLLRTNADCVDASTFVV